MTPPSKPKRPRDELGRPQPWDAEDLLELASSLSIEFMKDVGTALDHRDFDAKANKKLGELDSDSTTA